MPCWEVRTVSIEFTNKHKDPLLAALKAEGLAYSDNNRGKIYLDNDKLIIDLENQTATVRNNDYDLLNRIKRGYSREAIKEVAKKKKWLLKQQVDGKLVARRY